MGKVRSMLLVSAMLALLLTGVSVAFAHAELREAYPPVGAVYRWERPSEVRLSFTQEVALELSAIDVVNRQFQPVSTGMLQQDPEDKTIIFLSLPPLASGTYTVNWNSASVDGHSIQGSYDFTLLPREAVITSIVAPVVLVLMGILVWTRRAR